MKFYGSFLIRCWMIRNEENDLRTVFDVEYIQRGEHLRVSELDEANQWILQTLQADLNGDLIPSAGEVKSEPEELNTEN
ncbi:MAG TPA: hypothetical protein PKC13_10870 [Blastocatellia bacterium]|nr:hypothetical protein [Blastocatellia bacterium]